MSCKVGTNGELSHSLNKFSPDCDLTFNSATEKSTPVCWGNAASRQWYAKVKRFLNYEFDSYVVKYISFSSLYLSCKTQASSQQGLRGIRQREAEWLSIQMTRQTPHHHPAEDRFPKTSINGGIAVMALIFLTFMSSITRSGLSDGAVADWEAEGGVCVYGGCTKPCQTTPHTITNGRMRNPFGLLTLNFMNQTRQYFRFFSFWLSPSHSCVTPTSLWSNLELIINCFKGKADVLYVIAGCKFQCRLKAESILKKYCSKN